MSLLVAVPQRRFCKLILLSSLFVVLIVGAVCPAVNAQAPPSVAGQWSSVQAWPYRAIHAQLLPNGKVLFWDSYENADFPQLWDPATGTVTPAARAGYNIFCTAFSFLPDGRLLVVGGHISDNVGLNFASIYNPFNNTWTRVANMNDGRWYPTTSRLANGDVLTVSGMADTTEGMNLLPQVWQVASGSWRNLNNAQLQLPYYPYMFLAPNGKVFNAGPGQTTRYIDTAGSGAWTVVGNNNYGARNWGSAVMYEPGKVLISGGIHGDFYFSGSAEAPTATAETIDLNSPLPTWQYVAPMSSPRKHHNLTLLPDGTVLATGGSSGSEETNQNSSNPAYAAEVWNPATNVWTTLAVNSVYRGYHATAMLLPDGRVLSAGGDNGGASAELFSPPYLFRGARPTITSAPSTTGYGQTFFVGTPDTTTITKVTWISLAAVTHTNNMDQRINTLSFSPTGGGLSVTSPLNGNVCPPGYYMLFLVNSNGVPSVARMVRVESTAPVLPAAPSNLTATAVSTSQIDLSWTDNASNEDGFKIERCQGALCTDFVQISTVPANVSSYSNTGLSAATTYRYRVRAYNSAGDSGYSNTASATTLSLPTVPAPPSALTATAVSSRQINLAWNDNSNNESGFRIERAVGGIFFSEIAVVGANVTTYSDQNVLPGITYHYRVRAYNELGNSAYSNTASATPSLLPAAPTTPSTIPGAPFTDDFNDNTRSPNWVLGMIAASGNYDPSVMVTEANQQLEIRPRINSAGNAYNGYLSASSFNFTGLQAKIRLVQAPNGTHAEAVLTVGIDGGNRYIIGLRGGEVNFTSVINGAWSEISQSYDPSVYKYLRIRHSTSDDLINFETSADGLLWTLRRSVPRTIGITNVRVDLVAGSNGPVPSPGVAIFDDFRLETVLLPPLAMIMKQYSAHTGIAGIEIQYFGSGQGS
jgi:hypothetical protein